MYKIIKISNYGRTEVSDELVADNISNLEEAETMFNALEDSTGSKGPYWYSLVQADYVLYTSKP